MRTLLVLMLLGALTGGNDQRLFESGMAFKVNQNVEQAIREFQLLVDQYPESEYADNALFEIARFRLDSGDVDTATALLNRIITQYNRSDSADNAHLVLGRLQLANGELDQAYNTFFHIKGAFPDSDVLDEAYAGLGKISMMRGQYRKALYFLSRIYTRFSESPIFRDSLFNAAYCYYQIGMADQALKMVGQASEIQQDLKADNLTRNLLRFLLNRKYRTAKGYFQMEESPGLLEAGDDGTLYVSSDREAFIQEISVGKNKRRNTPGAVQALYYSQRDGLYYSTGDQIVSEAHRSPLRFNTEAGALREITSFFVDNFGQFWIYDKDTNLVYRFSKEQRLEQKLAIGDVDYIKLRSDGTIYVIKDSRDVIEIRDMTGKVLKQFAQYRDVVDLAFDSLGNVYMLEDKGRNLVVLTQDHQVFQQTPLQGITNSSTRYSHLAVDQGGSIFLANSREDRIVRVF